MKKKSQEKFRHFYFLATYKQVMKNCIADDDDENKLYKSIENKII